MLLGVSTSSEPGPKIKGQGIMVEMDALDTWRKTMHSSITILWLSTHPHPTPPQVREICGKFSRGVDLYWQAQALLALQEVRRGRDE